MIKRSAVCFLMFLFAAFFVAGCAGRQYAPNRGVMYYHNELPIADRAVEGARAEGKKCPVEFAAAEKMKNDAYDTYLACHTAEGIAKANKATAMANAICPAKTAAPAKKVILAAPVTFPVVAKKATIILGEVYFANDSFALTAEAKETLKKNIVIIKENSNTKISIEGHASAIGTKSYNMKLSTKRVDAVRNYLIAEGGISSDRLNTVAYGENEPIVKEKKPVTKESSAAKANRVVIEVVK